MKGRIITLFLLFFLPKICFSATEEFVEVRASETEISFFSAEGVFPFLIARLYLDSKGKRNFNLLPQSLSLKDIEEGNHLLKLEVLDKEKEVHTSLYEVILQDKKIASFQLLVSQGNRLVPITKDKKGEKLLLGLIKQEKDFLPLISLSQKFLVLFPESDTSEELLFNLANIYEESEEYPKAFFFYKKFIKDYPESEKLGRARLRIGRILFGYGKYEEARDVYEKTLAFFSAEEESAKGLFQLAYSYEIAEDYEKASAAYETYLLNYLEDSDYPLGIYRLANTYTTLGKILQGKIVIIKEEEIEEEQTEGKEAKETEEKKQEKKSELSPEEKEKKAKVYYIQAYRLYKAFLLLYSSHRLYFDSQLELAILCQELEYYQESLNYLVSLEKKNENKELIPKILYYQGLAKQSINEYKESITLFSKTMDYQNKEFAPLAKYQKGLSYFFLEDYSRGYGELNRFTSLYPEHHLLSLARYYSLACLFYEAVRKYSSEEIFELLQEKMTPIVEELKGLVMNYEGTEAGALAQALSEEGYEILAPEEEIIAVKGIIVDLSSYMEEALTKYPYGPDKTLLKEGMDLVKEKKCKEAGGYFLALLNKFPESKLIISAHYQLALVYGNLTAYKQGIREFKELIKINPKDELADDSQYLIGYYYLCLESYKNAQRNFEKVIKNYSDSPRALWARKDIQIMEQKGLLEKKEEGV